MRPKQILIKEDPLWYKKAIIYQLHVKAFNDSDRDGIGDFLGLVQKLDYLQNLGITAIWLLPFYPSPMKDDGYDISDYFDVHPNYGNLKDFQEFLKSAHYRGIRVITELVLNHTSNQHRWFEIARRSNPGSEMREFYVWSDTPEKYNEARIIFKDFETSNWTWDPVAKAYYWHRFYSHQPDLNFDNPNVQKAIFKVIDFWFSMGVDGLRLDAVPYLFEREGTNCENLPETHNFLKELRSYVDSNYKDKLLLAEANQWPEDAVTYFGHNDECHMAFHFPLMPRLFMALWMEDRFPIIDMLEQTPTIPEQCQWAMFLRNHDELTLEMVTDEERDYMYRIYAKDPRARINLGIRRRLAPLLNNNRRKIELLNFLLFSLPGTPIIYYGDEIGMGDNYFLGDRNGVRTPMQWSPDRNAGFSKANPQHLYLPIILDPEYHYEAVNVENQDKNLSSLLWWMKRVISMRKKFMALGLGSVRFLYSENPKVLAFICSYEEEKILVIINLSRFAQVAELNLAEFAGYLPIEIFSGNKFPTIKESPYILTLGIHDYFWFSLQKEETSALPDEERPIPEIYLSEDWEYLFQDEQIDKLEKTCLPKYLQYCRWFQAKARTIRQVQLVEDILLKSEANNFHLTLIEVQYTEGASEIYFLPLSYLSQEEAKFLEENFPQSIVAKMKIKDKSAYLFDCIYSDHFQKEILALIAHKKTIHGKNGKFIASPAKNFENELYVSEPALQSQVLKAEQTNTSVLYDNTYILKCYRKLEAGINPDSEIIAYLSDKKGFSNIAPFVGHIEYHLPYREKTSIALMQKFIPNQGDAWNFALDNIEHYLENILVQKENNQQPPELPSSILSIKNSKIPQLLYDCIGGYFLEMIALLGKITGELHLNLAQEEDSTFIPEYFSKHYQRAIYQSMRNLVRRTMESLRINLNKLPEAVKGEAAETLDQEQNILTKLAEITYRKIESQKIRIHGDYHLGQVLYTGNNFVIVDFEGEPARALSERRLKRSSFKDIAGMIRSFHYAVYSALFNWSSIRPEDISHLQPWIGPWYKTTSGIFLESYLNTVQGTLLVPQEKQDLETLLDTFLLEKAVYELGYELNNRPDWIDIPIHGIKEILNF